MDIILYTMQKRRNSTRRPSIEASLTCSAIINDGNTTVTSPALTLQGDANSNLVAYNYVYIQKWNRYYYIDDWRYLGNGLWLAACSVDVLASWRAYIATTPGYIDRWDCTNVDASAMDSFYPSTKFSFLKQFLVTLPFSYLQSQGTFIIGIVSSSAPNYGATTYYHVTPAALATLCNKMLGASTGAVDWTQIDSITGDVLKSIVNPMQYISSVKWFPFSYTATGSSENIFLASWDTGAVGTRLGTSVYKDWSLSTTLTYAETEIPSGEYPLSNFPFYPPYWTLTLFTPLWGTVDIDTTLLGRGDALRYDISVNLVTGEALLSIWAEIGNPAQATLLAKKYATIGIDVPLAMVATNYVDIAKSAINVGTSAVGMFFDPLGSAAGMLNGLIDGATAALSPSVQSDSNKGYGFNMDIGAMQLLSRHFRTVATDRAHFGRLARVSVSNLSSLIQMGTNSSGFCKFLECEFAAPCTAPERDRVEGYLKEGFFYE